MAKKQDFKDMKDLKQQMKQIEEECREPEINPLQAELDTQKAATAEAQDKYLRLAAEFDNFRKRTIKEKASMYADGSADVVEKLVPVLDNFERALQSEKDKESSLYVGITLILRQFTELLASFGISEIEALGQTFDPNVHNAVVHIEDAQYGENEIIDVLQKGYKLNEKIIRPTMVRVAN